MFAEFFVVNEPTSEADVVLDYTAHVLNECGGNKTVAARLLGIDRRSLYRRLDGIKYREDQRAAENGKRCTEQLKFPEVADADQP